MRVPFYIALKKGDNSAKGGKAQTIGGGSKELRSHLFVSYWYSCTTKAKWQEENFDDHGLCGM